MSILKFEIKILSRQNAQNTTYRNEGKLASKSERVNTVYWRGEFVQINENAFLCDAFCFCQFYFLPKQRSVLQRLY